MKKIAALLTAVLMCVSVPAVCASGFLGNGGMEDGSDEYAGSFTEMQNAAYDGNFALKAAPGGSIGITADGLEPGATYKLSAYAKSSGKNTFVFLAKSSGGSALAKDLWEDKQPDGSYIKYEGTFTMGSGPSDTKAEVGFFNLSDAELYADSFVLVKEGSTENLLANGDIEKGLTDDIVAGDICLSANSGEKFARIDNDCGMFRTVTGLTPGAEYEFSAYVAREKSDGNTPELLIKDIADTETQIAAHSEAYTGGWQKVSCRFTLPETSLGEVQLHVWNTTGGTVYADDLSLISFDTDDEVDIVGKNNLFINGNFEDPDVSMLEGEFTVEDGIGIGGTSAARLEPQKSVIQIINGLKPNTEYTVAAYVKLTDLSADTANLVIKQYGGDDIYVKTALSGAFKKVTASFVTGESSTSAEIAVWNSSAGIIYADEIFVYSDAHPVEELKDDTFDPIYKTKNNLIINGSFEDGNMAMFAGEHVREENSGLMSTAGVRVAPGNSLIQNISGLKPNTVYNFIAYVKTLNSSGSAANLVVKGFNGSEESYKEADKVNVYRKTVLTFKTGAKDTKAEVAVWNSSAGDILVDEMILYSDDHKAVDLSKVVNLITNGGFESAEGMEKYEGGVARVKENAKSGSYSGRIEAGGAAIQKFTNLTVGDTYTFSAYVKVKAKEGNKPCLVVKGYGGDDIYVDVPFGDDYVFVKSVFTVEKNGVVEISVWNNSNAEIFVDDLMLYSENAIPVTGDSSKAPLAAVMMATSAAVCGTIIILKRKLIH